VFFARKKDGGTRGVVVVILGFTTRFALWKKKGAYYFDCTMLLFVGADGWAE
jgi:hypothetical protein